MQLNSALFSLNGGTGYVLKPEWIRNPTKKKPPKQNIRIRVNTHVDSVWRFIEF